MSCVTRAASSARGCAKKQILMRFVSVIGACALLALAVQAQQPRLCERWQQAYAGEDATGTNVIGLWTLRGHESTCQARGWT